MKFLISSIILLNVILGREYFKKKRVKKSKIDQDLQYTVEQGIWGDWGKLQKQDDYICGFSFSEWNNSDDQIGMDGLQAIFCNSENWSQQKTVLLAGQSIKNLWNNTLCPIDSFVIGAQVRFYPKQLLGEDSAIQGMNIVCKNPYTQQNQTLTLTQGIKGEWKNLQQNGFFANGAIARHENGTWDNTALNGLIMYTSSFKCKQGYVSDTIGQNCFKEVKFCANQLLQNCLKCGDNFILNYNTCFQKINNCKFQQSDQCLNCNDNFVLIENQCVLKQKNCEKQSIDQCLKCKDQFLLLQGECFDQINFCQDQNKEICIKCEDNYVLQQNKCFQQIENCQSQSNSNCQICNSGYTLTSGVCFLSIAGCQQQNQQNCQQCNQNYTLFQNMCIQNSEFCIKQQSSSICLQCDDNYILQQSQCYLKIPNCQQQDKNNCQQCAQNYFLMQNQCINQIQNCQVQNNTICQQCQEQYILINNVCQLNYCTIMDKTNCLECQVGYQLQNNQCYEKISNCIQQEKDICLQCSFTFSLNTNKTACLFLGYINFGTRNKKLVINQKLVRNKKQNNQDQHCQLFDAQNKCIQCNHGYIKAGNSCFQNIEFCSNQIQDSCYSCQFGYILKQKKQCVINKRLARKKIAPVRKILLKVGGKKSKKLNQKFVHKKFYRN